MMTAGNCGWGCGSGPNAVANEKAVMGEYGWHNVAWVLYPSFAVLIDDTHNPIFLSLFGTFVVQRGEHRNGGSYTLRISEFATHCVS